MNNSCSKSLVKGLLEPFYETLQHEGKMRGFIIVQ